MTIVRGEKFLLVVPAEHIWKIIILILGLCFCIGRPAMAQCSRGILYTFTGEAAGDGFGRSVSGAGDVDNDGYTDLIVGANYNDAGGNNAGRAYVYSGRTGELLYTFTGESAGDYFGISVSGAGDVNNDGYADVIIGAIYNDAGGADAGRAYVYSGQTGGLLYAFSGLAEGDFLGNSVAGAGDVDNDGYADLIAGAHWNDAGGIDAGQAYVFSGKTGSLIHVFTGEEAGDGLGGWVAGAGDTDADGFADLIMGARNNNEGGVNAGRAYVYSGQTGDLLYTFTGAAANDFFGYPAVGAGDVNNDNYDDLLIDAYGHDAAGSMAGRVYVYCGRTGTLLYSIDGEGANDLFGHGLSPAGDVDGDQHSDLIAGAWYNDGGGADAGRGYVYSGQNGSLLYTFTGHAAGDQFGNAVSGAGDVDGDGYDDLIIGAWKNDAGGIDAGQAYVYTCLKSYQCGDANSDGQCNVGDAVFVINCVFRGGPSPEPNCIGDANSDDSVDVADAVYLINYIFSDGLPSIPTCCP